MRVLVTGATGFLGRRVVRRLLAQGTRVTALARTSSIDEVETLQGDLANGQVAPELLEPWRWDAVVNLAGPVTSGNEDLATGLDVVSAHVRIALHLRRYAASARIVHASSMTVYGLPDQVAVDEAHPRRPHHLYGLAKVLAEDVLLTDPDLDAWSLRLPGLFSEERKTGALYHFCRAARAGEAVRVTCLTRTPWNVLHVEDAADAIVRTLAAPSRGGGAINISYDEPVELVAVAQLIAQHAGTGAQIERSGDVLHPPLHLVTGKARQLLGWRPPSLRDRLTKLYGDYAAA